MNDELAWKKLRNSTIAQIIIMTSCSSASTAVRPLLKSNRIAMYISMHTATIATE